MIEYHLDINNNKIDGKNFYSDNKLSFVNNTLVLIPSFESEVENSGCYNDFQWNVC